MAMSFFLSRMSAIKRDECISTVSQLPIGFVVVPTTVYMSIMSNVNDLEMTVFFSAYISSIFVSSD